MLRRSNFLHGGGRRQRNWKAYCNIDTWFGIEQSVEEYHASGQDGLSEGVETCRTPVLESKTVLLASLKPQTAAGGLAMG